VKAAGFEVRGLAQVSMNLTDFEQTPVARVRFVKREAHANGVVPAQQRDCRLDSEKALGTGRGMVSAGGRFRFSLILENPSGGGDQRKDGDWRVARPAWNHDLSKLAAPPPHLAGGSASAAAGAMGALWRTWWAAMSRGKKAYVQHEQQTELKPSTGWPRCGNSSRMASTPTLRAITR